MSSFARSLHDSTPAITGFDPRGLAVRSVAYWRKSAVAAAETRTSRKVYNHRARQVAHWDPRLSRHAPVDPEMKANLSTAHSMNGVVLMTDSVDAGWRVNLANDAGGACAEWDSRGSHRQTVYDTLQRPHSLSETGAGSPTKVVERFSYGDPDLQYVGQNCAGRLIRHDHTAGSKQITGYSLPGAPVAQMQRFLKHRQLPDWPLELPQRDEHLSPEIFPTHLVYSPAGTLLLQRDAVGNCQRHHYDMAGQLTRTSLQLFGLGEQTVLDEISYNAPGQVESETAGNGVVSSAQYCLADGRLKRLHSRHPEGQVIQDLAYDYDPVGNVISIADSALVTRHFKNQRIEPVSTFAYDSQYQLIRATGRESCSPTNGPELPADQPLPPDPNSMANYVQTYDYDDGGNLMTLVHLGAQQFSRQMLTANNSNRSLPVPDENRDPDFSEHFDANGNLTRLQAGPALEWNLRDQLQQITLISRFNAENDNEWYAYDGSGQRTRKVRTSQARNVTHVAEVLYLPGLEIRTDTDGGEILHVISVHVGRTRLRVLHWASPPPDRIANDQMRYGLSDHLGSCAIELDGFARLVSREGFYPFGGTAWFAARSETEAKYKSIRYSGKERDVSGLYYYGFRYYVSWWLRWLNPDPAGAVDGLNLYRMVGNNPMSMIDPDGLMGDKATPPVAPRPGPPPIPSRPDSTLSSNHLSPAQSASHTRKASDLTTILKWQKPSNDLLQKRTEQLLNTSTAEGYLSVTDYIEAGHQAHNNNLRNLASDNGYSLTPETAELVSAILTLEKMSSSFVAYRSIRTTEAGYQGLQKIGNQVADLGLQSASTNRHSAENWGRSWADGASFAERRVMILFGEDVPKVNLATGFLPDHVAVLPAESLKVSEFEIRDGHLYVLLTKPSEDEMSNNVTSIFDGRAIENFSTIRTVLGKLRNQPARP